MLWHFDKFSLITARERTYSCLKGIDTVKGQVKGQAGVDKIIVKKQPYQLLNANHEFFPSFDASNFHRFVD